MYLEINKIFIPKGSFFQPYEMLKIENVRNDDCLNLKNKE